MTPIGSLFVRGDEKRQFIYQMQRRLARSWTKSDQSKDKVAKTVESHDRRLKHHEEEAERALRNDGRAESSPTAPKLSSHSNNRRLACSSYLSRMLGAGSRILHSTPSEWNSS